MASEEDDIPYTKAMSELQELLSDIDNEDVDLDELAEKVERAAELIEVCREKIERTEMQIKTIIADLEEDEADEAGGDET